MTSVLSERTNLQVLWSDSVDRMVSPRILCLGNNRQTINVMNAFRPRPVSILLYAHIMV